MRGLHALADAGVDRHEQVAEVELAAPQRGPQPGRQGSGELRLEWQQEDNFLEREKVYPNERIPSATSLQELLH